MKNYEENLDDGIPKEREVGYLAPKKSQCSLLTLTTDGTSKDH